MSAEYIDTLIVGAGQAGIAISEHLSNNGISHLILEKNRIAESWRTGRWDSLVANGPAWHDRFPGMIFPNINPDGFPSKEAIADYFSYYAKMINAPIRTNVTVKKVQKNTAKPGFLVETSDGEFEAQNIVCATGAFQHPIIPPVMSEDSEIMQMHSYHYRNPEQLPSGAVLVVGAGSSGAQIADELLRSRRQVYLSVGPHDRPPRAYRERDFVWWLGVLGKWDAAAMEPGTEHVTIAVSGAEGGHTVDFRRFANRGMTLVGRTQNYQDGIMYFAPDLVKNVNSGDANYLTMLNEADAYITRNGLDLPLEPDARNKEAEPSCMRDPVLELNLQEANIKTVIWATGFTRDYSWLDVDAFEEDGSPRHQRGVSTEPGIYFLGLPWQSRRGSSFIWGVWHDARFLADHISTQRQYREYTKST